MRGLIRPTSDGRIVYPRIIDNIDIYQYHIEYHIDTSPHAFFQP